MNSNNVVNQPLSGINYLIKGAKLLRHPKLRTFVLVPLIINILIFASAFWFLFSSITDWIESYMQMLPELLSWLSYILWPIIVFSILFVFSFLFSTVANLIAAPFNGLLAEKTEILLTKQTVNDDGWQDLFKDLPRILKRECQKWLYFLPRILGCLILFWVPVIGQTIAPIVWFIFAGWMMAIQYADYPFDNHKVSFAMMRKTLGKKMTKNITFGMIVSFCTTIPVLNFIIMPIAVCGATAAWVDLYKEQALSESVTVSPQR
ncbi:sulfate transporter CysZ [Psychromonas aquatilis]|uniref:Sulfate transporter CysZ n=1 Tax=Psychromonas aquatilis TaxID=2005072 RepID=A0ABU9GQP6_9GAMM